MLETNTKHWEKTVFEKGIEKNTHDVALKMIKIGLSDTDIRKVTGLTLSKIARIRKQIYRNNVMLQCFSLLQIL